VGRERRLNRGRRVTRHFASRPASGGRRGGRYGGR
jgi:hypothetical protein